MSVRLRFCVEGVELRCPACGGALWRTKSDRGFALLCVGPAAFTPVALAARRAALLKHGTEHSADAHEARLQANAVDATGCGRIIEKGEARTLAEAEKIAARRRGEL